MSKITRGAVALSLGAMLWVSCDAGADRQGDAPDSGATVQNAFQQSYCGECIQTTCQDSIARCAADPECGAHLQCLFDCPTSETGDVDQECEAACPTVTGSVASAALTELRECRAVGAGNGCSTCRDSEWIVNQTCPPTNETNPCWACEDTYCCETWGEYESNPDAQAMKQCVIDCSLAEPDGCEAACAALHPRGLPAWARRIACVLIWCSEGDACGAGELSDCERCTNTACGLEWVEFYGDAVGYLLFNCMSDCAVDSPCWYECLEDHPLAVHLWEAFSECALAECATECG